MKKLLLVLLLASVASVSARAEFVSADVGVDGLTCSMCSKGTEATLNRLSFIDTVWIDLNDLVAHIKFKKDADVSIDDIRKMVEDAGFSVRSISAVFNFDNVKVGKDFHFVYQGNTYHFIGASEKTLSGPVPIRFVDKPYIKKDEFATLAKQTDLTCYANDKTEMCCEGDHSVTGKLYHIAL